MSSRTRSTREKLRESVDATMIAKRANSTGLTSPSETSGNATVTDNLNVMEENDLSNEKSVTSVKNTSTDSSVRERPKSVPGSLIVKDPTTGSTTVGTKDFGESVSQTQTPEKTTPSRSRRSMSDKSNIEEMRERLSSRRSSSRSSSAGYEQDVVHTARELALTKKTLLDVEETLDALQGPDVEDLSRRYEDLNSDFQSLKDSISSEKQSIRSLSDLRSSGTITARQSTELNNLMSDLRNNEERLSSLKEDAENLKKDVQMSSQRLASSRTSSRLSSPVSRASSSRSLSRRLLSEDVKNQEDEIDRLEDDIHLQENRLSASDKYKTPPTLRDRIEEMSARRNLREDRKRLSRTASRLERDEDELDRLVYDEDTPVLSRVSSRRSRDATERDLDRVSSLREEVNEDLGESQRSEKLKRRTEELREKLSELRSSRKNTPTSPPLSHSASSNRATMGSTSMVNLSDTEVEREVARLSSGRSSSVTSPLSSRRGSSKINELDIYENNLRRYNIISYGKLVDAKNNTALLKVYSETGDSFAVKVDLSDSVSVTLRDGTVLTEAEGEFEFYNTTISPEECAKLPTCGVMFQCNDTVCVLQKEGSGKLSKKGYTIKKQSTIDEMTFSDSLMATPVVRYEDILSNWDTIKIEVANINETIRSRVFANLQANMNNFYNAYSVYNTLKTALDQEVAAYSLAWNEYQLYPEYKVSKPEGYKVLIDKLFQLKQDYSLLLSKMNNIDSYHGVNDATGSRALDFLEWAHLVTSPYVYNELTRQNVYNEQNILTPPGGNDDSMPATRLLQSDEYWAQMGIAPLTRQVVMQQSMPPQGMMYAPAPTSTPMSQSFTFTPATQEGQMYGASGVSSVSSTGTYLPGGASLQTV